MERTSIGCGAFRVKLKATLRQATRAEIADADELAEGCFAANGDCAGLAAFYFRRGPSPQDRHSVTLKRAVANCAADNDAAR
jgi:hypothetical protein